MTRQPRLTNNWWAGSGCVRPPTRPICSLSAKRIFKAHLSRVIQEYAGQDAATAKEIQALEEFIERLAKKS